MKKKTEKQYTIRQVPDDIDKALRKWAVREGSSLNTVVLDALRIGSGATEYRTRFHDLDALAGTWVEDKAVDKAMEAFERVDEDLWK